MNFEMFARNGNTTGLTFFSAWPLMLNPVTDQTKGALDSKY